MTNCNLTENEWWKNFRAGLRFEVEAILDRLRLPDKGRRYVYRALANPSRRTRSGVANLSGAYPSQKMGVTLGFESRTLEFSQIVSDEVDPFVRAYVTQLPEIKLSYRNEKTGRISGYLQRPDLLEIYEDRIDIVECKPEKVLQGWLHERTGFVYLDKDDRWRCPAAEQASSELGLNYRIVSERHISPVRIKNFSFLTDYVHTAHDHGRGRNLQAIKNLVSQQRRLSIEQVIDLLRGQIIVSDIYRAIATGVVAVDLDKSLLLHHDRTFLFSTVADLEAHKLSAEAISNAKPWMIKSELLLKDGAQLNWDGRNWTLLNLGHTKVTLNHANDIKEVDRFLFDNFVTQGSILIVDADESTDQKSDASHKLLQKASQKDISVALKAYRLILPFRDAHSKTSPSRSVRRYLSMWRNAEAAYGNGFIGLIPNYSSSGNRLSRIDPTVMQIVQQQTLEHYATTKNSKRNHVHGRIVELCQKALATPPSYAWFCRYISKLPAYELKKAREGRKAAYNLEPRHESNSQSTLPNSAVAFFSAHLDHTELEIELRCSSTGVALGRPWLSTLVDGATKVVLAWYLTWDPPSYRSALMVFRDCVRRHNRLPFEVLVDGGKDMASIWFETTCAFFNVIITRRPAGKPRFGSQGERVFGTINTTFLYNCAGNTQLRKNVRQMTPEVDPNHQAVWTMGALIEAFELYMEHYEGLPHRGVLASPREAMKRGLYLAGERPERKFSTTRIS